MVGTLVYIPLNKPASHVVSLPLGATLEDAKVYAADLMDAEPPLVVHEIDSDIKAFTLVQDGMYDYNLPVTYAIENMLGIKVALEGPVVLCMLPPELLSR